MQIEVIERKWEKKIITCRKNHLRRNLACYMEIGNYTGISSGVCICCEHGELSVGT